MVRSVLQVVHQNCESDCGTSKRLRIADQPHSRPTQKNSRRSKVKEHAEGRRATALKDTWLEGEKADLLGFADFGQLAQIIIAKWDHFKDVVPTQHWLKQRMDEMEKARNFIAHNRMLLPSEFQRLYMYIADWNRAIGL
ncbi:Swt1 family HEPN domain-containing protein [Bradyrhizobium elkanii]|uniref:Swt1 family HEPN domain-containing protein n=1 Tax=Bradyrhizobium elkanii TaxID=29448 RepID=UPI001444091F